MQNSRKYIHASQIFSNSEKDFGVLQQILIKMTGKLSELKDFSKNVKSINMLIKFCEASIEEQRAYFENNTTEILECFFEVTTKLYHDKTLMEYMLSTINGILFDDKKNIKKFIRFIEDQLEENNFIASLNKCQFLQSQIAIESACRIQAQLFGDPNFQCNQKVKLEFIQFLLNNENQQNKISYQGIFACFIHILKDKSLVEYFLKNDGINLIIKILKSNSNELQLIYYVLISLWLIAYNPISYPYFTNPVLKIIKLMVEVMQKLSREKVIRVALSCFRLLIDNCTETIELMVDAQLLKVLETCKKGNLKDPDMNEDIEYIGSIIEKNLKILSSFEKYVKEINTQALEWTPVHTEKFWREHVKQFETNDFNLIQKLVHLLSSSDSTTVAVACYDLGEFCRYHPFGRNVVDKLGGKKIIMDQAGKHKDQKVRENALLALQKIMIQNWQSISSDQNN